MKVFPSIIQDEFINLHAKIVKSSNPTHIGLSGKIIDETRNTFTIIHEGKKKIIPKNHTVFHFTLPDGTVVEIEGNLLLGSPDERVKKRVRRLW
jgi:ribonuclease P protein subunit POP4